jgi:hypothetical protein
MRPGAFEFVSSSVALAFHRDRETFWAVHQTARTTGQIIMQVEPYTEGFAQGKDAPSKSPKYGHLNGNGRANGNGHAPHDDSGAVTDLAVRRERVLTWFLRERRIEDAANA